MDGKIFDIVRFSIFDGPGIRTNVYLKGCNLKCKWCHNPESQSIENQLLYYKSRCIGCGKCADVCKNTFTESCVACGKCVDACNNNARKIAGKTVFSDEIIKTVLKDKAFYETSGGGLTLSGGEPLLQIDYAVEILKKCKENGINTAIETAGNVSWSSFEKVLPYLDYMLFDIKCVDEDLHINLTGASNKTILENAQMLKNENVDLTFRMPVIPTLNENEIGKVKKLAGDIPVELFAYHKTGCVKYSALNRKYEIDSIVPPTVEYMKSLAQKYDCIYAPTGI